ncbi:MAG TPA: sugar nucleotide-binding protein, partial [Planctomycetota bacterium]|nr:sugar nucleotide-binding protein [Planctomycetota bacterium]
ARDYLIVRTSWLYGAAGRNFVATIRRLAVERDELQVVDDQRGCPTWTRDLANAIVALLATDPSTALGEGVGGIVHAAGSGVCSWYDFACEIVKRSGLATPVRPIKSAEMPRPARRPANSALDCSRLAQLTGFHFPHWRESLAAFLAGLDRPDET